MLWQTDRPTKSHNEGSFVPFWVATLQLSTCTHFYPVVESSTRGTATYKVERLKGQCNLNFSYIIIKAIKGDRHSPRTNQYYRHSKLLVIKNITIIFFLEVNLAIIINIFADIKFCLICKFTDFFLYAHWPTTWCLTLLIIVNVVRFHWWFSTIIVYKTR